MCRTGPRQTVPQRNMIPPMSVKSVMHRIAMVLRGRRGSRLARDHPTRKNPAITAAMMDRDSGSMRDVYAHQR